MSEKSTPAKRSGRGLLALALGIIVIVGGCIWWGVTQNQGESKYGSFDLPGQTVVDLPAGKVDLSFTMDLSNQTVAIPVMQMTITPVDGGAGPAVDGTMGAALSDNGITHIRVGSAIVPRAGRYRVAADGGVGASPNPQLHIGVRNNPFPVVLTTLGIGLILIIAGIVVMVRSFRGLTPSEAPE